MNLSNYIINDVKPLAVTALISDLKEVFNQLTYSHFPIMNNEGVYLGCVSETDVHCFDTDKELVDYLYSAEGFFVRDTENWLNVLEAFAQNNSNIMPVLGNDNSYKGYYELNDIISLFNATPFLSEAGGILIVEKGINDYTFSQIAQIVESNNGRLLGAFVSKLESDMVQITVKIGNASLNDIIQSFRRYSYNILSNNEDDSFLASLKERSDYLNKYLDI